MSGKVIGKNLGHGFAGQFARTPDMIITTRVAGGEITFGDALIYGSNNSVVKATGSATMANFAGIAAAEVKSVYDYDNQDVGTYLQNEAVSVFERGSISVVNKNGVAALNGPVYLAITTSAFSGAAVGDLCAAVTGTANTDYIVLTNAKWGGPSDANGITELILLTRANA